MVGDFGIAKPLEQLAGTPIGPVIYLAPEIELEETYDHRVDIFSFGILLYDLWHQHGQPSYYDNLLHVRKQLISRQPIYTENSCPSLYTELISWCCHPDPNLRPPWDVILSRLSLLSGPKTFSSSSFPSSSFSM